MRTIQMENSQAPLSEGDVKGFEERYGIELPAEYRAFLLQHNGGAPTPERFETENGITESCVAMFYSLGELAKDFETLCIGEMIPRNLLPIGLDPIRNRICVSVTGEDAGHVFYWALDEEEGEVKPSYDHMYRIAKGFGEFLDRLFMPKE